jgi:phosphoribosyl-ATP pyrophosphohydrolase
MADRFKALEDIIAQRRGTDPALSYVAKLFAQGRTKIAQKIGEEATETVIAALSGDPRALTSEAADLLFHLIILLQDGGVSLDDVAAELARREGVSGLVEKAARSNTVDPH